MQSSLKSAGLLSGFRYNFTDGSQKGGWEHEQEDKSKQRPRMGRSGTDSTNGLSDRANFTNYLDQLSYRIDYPSGSGVRWIS